MAEKNKDDTFWAVLNAAIELDFKRGHLRWTMSELSRVSKITRSLIYYYFGKSKDSILLEAVKQIGEEMLGLNESRVQLWQRGEVAESVILSRRMLEKSPHMAAFYIVHRRSDSDIGGKLRELELEYMQKLRRFLPAGDEAKLEAIFGLFTGLVVAPKMSEEAVRVAVGTLMSVMKKN